MKHNNDAFKDFTLLADHIYLYEPVKHEGVGTSTTVVDLDPSTIIIYGWGDAQLKHLAKYADGYKNLFPTSRIIVVTSSLFDAFYRSAEHRSKLTTPVISAAFPNGLNDSDDGRILIHAMSNSGAVTFVSTLLSYTRMLEEDGQSIGSGPLPHTLLVCDSTPSTSNFAINATRWARALSTSTARMFPWPLAFTNAMWYTFLWLNEGLRRAMGLGNTGAFALEAMTNPNLTSHSATRLFIYSKEDELISWEDIEENAAIAIGKGYKCLMELFEGSTHVGHLRKDPERYWSSIEKVWKVGLVSQRFRALQVQ